MKKSKIILLFLITTLLNFSCNNDDNSSGGGSAQLNLTIDGAIESFNMSNQDWNEISSGNCTDFFGPNAIVEYIDIGNFSNGSFTLWVGNNTIEEGVFPIGDETLSFCSRVRIEIYISGGLENRLQSITNQPILKLEPNGISELNILNFDSNRISLEWEGRLNVLGYDDNILRTLEGSFIASNVFIEDFR